MPSWAPIAVMAIGLLAILWFDFGPSLPFNDDWGMSWGARQLIQHQRLRVFPEQSALALTQNLWSALVTFGHTDSVALRLSNYPMVVATAFLVFAISRRLGASSFWSGIGAATLVASPVYSNLGAAYMTEPAYIALLFAAAYSGIRWQDGRWWRVAFIVLVVLATLQRQVGAVIPLALLGALLAARGRPSSRAEYLWLLAALAAAAIATIAPIVSNIAPPTQGNRVRGLAQLQVSHQLQPLLLVGLQLGFYLAPWGLPIILTKRSGRATGLVPFLSIAVSLLGFFTLARHGPFIFPNSTFRAAGLVPVLLGVKPTVYPDWSVDTAVGLALLCMQALFLWRADYWRTTSLGYEQTLLVALSLFNFLPTMLLQTEVFDRYYLVAAAPLIPVVAVMVSKADLSPRRETVAMVFAGVVVLAGILGFVVGEQDYQAWQQARDQAARMAYKLAPPDRVDAGYEANAAYVEIPLYDATGSVPGGLARSFGDYGFPIDGPRHPLIRLEYASPSDPRLGVPYNSVSPGKIILNTSPVPERPPLR